MSKALIALWAVIECGHGAEIVSADFYLDIPFISNPSPYSITIKPERIHGSMSAQIYIKGRPLSEIFVFPNEDEAWNDYKNKLYKEKRRLEEGLSLIDKKIKRANEGKPRKYKDGEW